MHGFSFVSPPNDGAASQTPGGQDARETGLHCQSIPKNGKGENCSTGGACFCSSLLNAGVTHPAALEAWLATGQKKICLKVPDESHFATLVDGAKDRDVAHHMTQDAGHTQIPKGSKTVLALGPADESVLDELTGHLKLL